MVSKLFLKLSKIFIGIQQNSLQILSIKTFLIQRFIAAQVYSYILCEPQYTEITLYGMPAVQIQINHTTGVSNFL
jgi:hypothetical protein